MVEDRTVDNIRKIAMRTNQTEEQMAEVRTTDNIRKRDMRTNQTEELFRACGTWGRRIVEDSSMNELSTRKGKCELLTRHLERMWISKTEDSPGAEPVLSRVHEWTRAARNITVHSWSTW